MGSGVSVVALLVGISAGVLTGCGSAEKVGGRVSVGGDTQAPVAARLTPAERQEDAPPSDVAPSTIAPSTVAPSTIAPSTVPPTTIAPVRPAAPKTTTVKRVVVEDRKIAFPRVAVQDSSLEKGRKVVTRRGVAGTKRMTYELTLVNGVETHKRLVRQVVVKAPVSQITSIGTKVAQPTGNCDPNYAGGCVPIASDVDCAGGSGNGPAYVQGPVDVVGTDIYRLDADHDGIGCED
jgi:hypothetical protein